MHIKDTKHACTDSPTSSPYVTLASQLQPK